MSALVGYTIFTEDQWEVGGVMHSRNLVVIEGVCGGGGGGGGVGGAFVVSGVSGVDKYRRTGLGNCGSLGRYASFFKTI